jgi:DNA-binding LacI/PurR family transcriptional regulator
MSGLRDVAERAGVSLATASRVASGSTNVRPQTRAKVERAMRELLYVPPHPPEAPEAIGLFVPEFGNPVFGALAQAMETRATDAGFATILCNTAGSPTREVGYVHMLLERHVAGMIFVCSEINDLRGDHAHYAKLVERGARLVFVNGGSDVLDVTSVGVDERAAGRIATEHLIELGHRRIGFVAGTAHVSPTRDKALGRADALDAAGLDADGLVEHSAFTVEGGRAAIRALLAREEPPSAVICSNDLMAIGVLQEALAAGLRVPGDLSVVGFDGIEPGGWTQPPLTTVEQPIGDIAAAAVGALLARVHGSEQAMPRVVFRPRLRCGGTTAPPA